MYINSTFYLNISSLQFLVDNGADEECLTGISDIFNHRSQVEDTHNAVDSEYKLNKYIRVQFGYVAQYQYVLFLEMLKALSQHDYVFAFVMEDHRSHDGALRDYGDGDFYKDNPLFNTECKALQILLYLYEFTASNPIGHNVKNFKLGGFYMLLGNVPPKYRSQQYVIQLFILCMSSIIKQIGFEVELLMHDLKTLKTEGLLITRSGDNLFYGTVSVVLTDNLGAHSIGGFLESFHCLRNCRFCFTPRETMQTIMNCSDLPMRSVKIHTAQLGNVQQAQSLSSSYSSNKPTTVSSQLRNFEIKQTAAQMWCLVRILPLIINVLQYACASELDRGHVMVMKDIIEYVHESFRQIFPEETKKPKMPFIFEGMHNYFKELVHRTKNKINICTSLAVRHQYYQCCLMPVIISLPQVNMGGDCLEVFTSTSVNTIGITYHVGDCIYCLTINGAPYLLCCKMETRYFDRHIYAYTVREVKDKCELVQLSSLKEPYPSELASIPQEMTMGTLAMNEWSALIDRAYKAKSSIIEYVHESFRQIFPEETIKPKIHFMLHYPQQMKSFGANLEQMKRFC
ncbi:hypothetical protein GQR58_001470 [Nymphon striatum]|nr:hypothetical protein GQR58_001470 [Nymphon striatum]